MDQYEIFTENAWQQIPNLSKLTINGQALEKASPELLDVRNGDLAEHIALQSSGTVWIGAAAAAADHKLHMKKVEYDLWEREKKAEVEEMLRRNGGSKGPTISSIENAFAKIYKSAIIDKEREISALESDVAALKAYAAGWKEKSYALSFFLKMREDEKFSPTKFGNDRK